MRRTITLDDKINMVLRYLVAKIDPTTNGSHLVYYEEAYGKKRTPHPVTYLDCKGNTDAVPEELPLPFDDIVVYVDKKRIIICGNDFYYKFSPHFILTLQERFKTFTK